MKTLIAFYSTYGHVYKMARAVEKGAEKVEGNKVLLRRIPETLSDEVLGKMGALEAQRSFSSVPEVSLDNLVSADAILFGTPTRFGSKPAQIQQFLDSTGGLWMQGALIGKVGSVFASTATQHGGQESTILSFHTSLLHHGMVIAGLPYSFQGQMEIDRVAGGSPYGATTIAGGKGERQPSESELAAAEFQGEHVARIALKLAG